MTEEQIIHTPQIKIATFVVGGECFALKIDCTQEILIPQEITIIPKVPIFINGIMNLRGKIITIININYLFHLPEKPQDEETRVIILTFKDTCRLGIWVDNVIGISSFSEDLLETTSNILIKKEDVELIKGIINDNGTIINVLDSSKLISYIENYTL
ncbi:MAG: chemotaxis protein CheW [bacterium]